MIHLRMPTKNLPLEKSYVYRWLSLLIDIKIYYKRKRLHSRLIVSLATFTHLKKSCQYKKVKPMSRIANQYKHLPDYALLLLIWCVTGVRSNIWKLAAYTTTTEFVVDHSTWFKLVSFTLTVATNKQFKWLIGL